MGEPRAARPLVASAGVVPQVHRNDRRRVVLRVQYAQPVGQGEGLVADPAALHGEQRGDERNAMHAHSGDGTTGPVAASWNEKAPSSVSPFTTRRTPLRVVNTRKPPLLRGRTSNRPAGTSIVTGASATKLSVASESPNSLYARAASESPGRAFVTAAASSAYPSCSTVPGGNDLLTGMTFTSPLFVPTRRRPPISPCFTSRSCSIMTVSLVGEKRSMRWKLAIGSPVWRSSATRSRSSSIGRNSDDAV